MGMTYKELLGKLASRTKAAKVVASFPQDREVNLRELGKALDDAGLTTHQVGEVHQVLPVGPADTNDPFEGLTRREA